MRAREDTVISGAHVVLYSNDATRDRAFLRDVLGFVSVDAGQGWLIFALPPAEVAVHPADPPSGEQNPHELYFLCDDLKSELEGLRQKGVQCSNVREERWGSLSRIRLPSGSEIGLYQPKHPTALKLAAK
jgi:catechol 2,3-dioxygenase-like lactoylglutathione lyase family enzyme